MSDAGADQYTFHLEATRDVPGLCRKIKETGMKVLIIFSKDTLESKIKKLKF